MHNTMTFETVKDQARNVGINVIQEIPEDELDAVPRITPEMVKLYGNTEFVQFGKDRKTISFSFGIPMPN